MIKILAILVIAVLLFLFVFSYIKNKKTPAPECENKRHCEGCKLDCAFRGDKE